MAETKKTIERIPTGVPRLDLLLKGGLFQGGFYVVQGPPGMGKTILANQICYEQARNGRQSVFVSLLAESVGRMVAYLEPLNFVDLDAVGKSVHYVSGYRILKEKGSQGLLEMLKATIKEHKARVVIIDGGDNLEQKTESESDFREFLHALQTYGPLVNCTTIILTPSAPAASLRLRPENAICDGVIELSEMQFGPRAVREIQVKKFRGGDFLKGRHEIEVTSDGVVIHPRTEVQFQFAGEGKFDEHRTRMKFGVPEFDNMLRGGLLSGSMTTLVGAPGTGKTTLGISFLIEGAAQGEHGIYFGFYETPPRLVEKAALLGLDLKSGVDKGLIELQWQQPVENIVDALAERLLERIRIKNQKKIRVFIDGMSGFRRSIPYPDRFGSFFPALTNELRNVGATTIFSEETDLFAADVILQNQEMVSTVDNVIFLRYVELRSQIYRLLSIMKVRESGFDSALREFVISDKGIELANSFESAEGILTGHARTLEKPKS